MATTGDIESFQLSLRLAAAPGNEAYKVTIGLSQVDLVVEVIDLDLRDALRSAAEQCATRLRERGYAVTASAVRGALEDALESSDVIRRRDQYRLN